MELKNLINKKYYFITKSGDHSIKYILKLVNDPLLLQDQGGWITYKQFAKKNNLNIIELKTDYGLIDPTKLVPNSTLLVNSMPGYHVLEDMEKIEQVCKENNIFLINDVSGSIGNDAAKYGDVILGSFGKDKPINLRDGGFIATNNQDIAEKLKDIPKYELKEGFQNEFDRLESKLNFYRSKRKKIFEDLKDYNIIHKDSKGINVIVLFANTSEKEKLETYCKDNNFEYTTCPRYIRVNSDAVSIELKRLQEF